MTRHKTSRLVLTIIIACAGCAEIGVPPAVGTLERDRIELIAEQQEPIIAIKVIEGERVGAGDAIIELDSRRAEARIAAAQGALDLAKARSAELVRGTRPEQIEEARARLEEAKSSLLEVEPQLERAKELVADGVQPQSALDTAEASHAAAQARLQAAKATLERLLNGATVEELEQAEAEVKNRQAQLEELRLSAERLRIVAPRAATVETLPFELGEQPPAGATVAVLLADSQPYARVYVPSEIRTHIVAGQSARVHVEGYESSFSGRVRFVSSEAGYTPYFALTEQDRGRLVYLAEIDLEDAGAEQLPTGLPVEVRF